MAEHTAGNHQISTGTWLALGAAAGTAAVTLSPYLLPVANSEALRHEVIMGLHGTNAGTGLAGTVNGLLGAIPGVGPSLAAGGAASIFGTALFGIGGVMLSNWLAKREQEDPTRPKWSKTVRIIALSTSLLIALPSILTGLSIGITFLASAMGSVGFASGVMTLMANTLGSAGAVHVGAGLSGLAVSALPHLLTCGAALAPLALGFFMGQKKDHTAEPPRPTIEGPLQLQGRVQAQPAMAHAH